MALALDVSTPALVSVPSDTATTASFTPPAGAVLYAIALHDTAVSNNPRASTLTDSTGLTWTLRADTGTTPPPNGGLARLYTAVVATSAPMTVTATITSNGYTGTALRVLVYTGADTVNPVDGAVAAGSAGAVISQGVAASFAGVVPWLGNVDWNGNTTGAPTAAAGTTTDTSVQPYSGGLGARMWIATAAPVSGAGTYTLASSAPTTGSLNSWVAFGVRPSGSLFTTQVPGIANVFENQPVTVATTVEFSSAGTVAGGRFFAPTTIGSGTFELALWQVTADDNPAVTGTGTLLGTASFGTLTAGAWNTVYFSSPISVSTGVAYRISVRTSEGRYSATGAFFNSASLVNGSITAQQTGTDPVGIGNLDNGSYIETITTYPNKTFNGNCYFVDVAGFAPAAGAPAFTLTSLPGGTIAAPGRDDLYSAFALRSRPGNTLSRGATDDFTLNVSSGFTLATLPGGTLPAGATDGLTSSTILTSRPGGTTGAGTGDALNTGLVLTTIAGSTLTGPARDTWTAGAILSTLPGGSAGAGALDTFTAGTPGGFVLTSLPGGSTGTGTTTGLTSSTILLSLPSASSPAGAAGAFARGDVLAGLPENGLGFGQRAFFAGQFVLAARPGASLPAGSRTTLTLATPGGITSSPNADLVTTTRDRVLTSVSRARNLTTGAT